MQKFSREYFELHQANGWLEAANVPGADPAAYKPLNHCWFADQKQVYFEGRRLKYADAGSFVALNEMFAKDRNKVYSKHGAARVHDVASFEVLDEGYFSDSIRGTVYAGYARDRHVVYFADHPYVEPRAVPKADAASFVSLGNLYGKDAHRAFYAGKVLAGASSAQFEVLNQAYTRDAENVYYFGSRVEGAIAADFEVVEGNRARDSARVYDCGQVIDGADPRTFRWFDTCTACDAQHVWVHGQIQPHVDAASFEYLGHDYFADKNGVYWRGKPIVDADRSTFRVLGRARAKDKRAQYRGEEREGGSKTPRQQPPRAAREESVPIKTAEQSEADELDELQELFSEEGSFVIEGEDESDAAQVPDRELDLEVLAATLAGTDAEALSLARRALKDPAAFIEAFTAREEAADEPAYASRLSELDPEEVSPLDVLLCIYEARQLVGMIDWRSDTRETINEVEPMLWRLGVRDFDWSFVDVLSDIATGRELANQNFLTLLRDRLRARGLAFAHLSRFSDSVTFAVLPPQEFEKINGMHEEDMLRVCDDFGADDAYDNAKRLLERAEQ